MSKDNGLSETERWSDRDPKSELAKAQFLAVLRVYGNVTCAAREIGKTRDWAYKMRKRYDEFSEAWDDAMEQASDILELEARRRAVNGVAKPVYQRGECVGTVQEYSDSLMSLLLKAHKPEKYRERSEVVQRRSHEDDLDELMKEDGE